MSKKFNDEEGRTYSSVVLDGRDTYQVWSYTMKEHLTTANLLTVVLEESSSTDEKDELKKRQQAKSMLLSVIAPSEIAKITHCKSAHEIWMYFEKTYGAKTSNVKLELMHEISNTSFSSANEVCDGVNKILATRDKLKNLDVLLDDIIILDVVIKALPESFGGFLANWRMLDAKEQTLERLISKLNEKARELSTEEEVKMFALRANINTSYNKTNLTTPASQQHNLANQHVNMPTRNQNRTWGGSSQGRPNGGYKPSSFAHQRNKTQNPTNVCNYCRKPGHWKSECFKLKYKNSEAARDKVSFMAVLAINTKPAMLTQTLSSDKWVVDSGCSSHMTPNKFLIKNMKPVSGAIKVRVGDGNLLEIEGVGEVITNIGRMKRVYYVPKLNSNLFSVASVIKRGNQVVFTKEKVTIKRNGEHLVEGKKEDGIFVVRLPIAPQRESLAAMKATTIETWHQRFAHTPVEVIQKMAKENLVENLEIVLQERRTCLDCALNKCKRVSHKSRTSEKAKKPGNVLHADLMGPVKPEGLNGQRFILVCKDEFSKLVMTASLSKKSSVPEVMKLILSRVEVQTGNHVLRLVTDNGSEFMSERLGVYLENKGIDRRNSAPYVHQQNGTIERENQTIVSRARAILNASRLDIRLWPEAISTACYISNRILNTTLNKTPFELYYNKKPDVKNLRVFGQQASVMRYEHQKDKFDTKGIILNFVGYTDHFNTYKFFDPETRKFCISCDATFLDEVGPAQRNPSSSRNIIVSNHQETEHNLVELDMSAPVQESDAMLLNNSSQESDDTLVDDSNQGPDDSTANESFETAPENQASDSVEEPPSPQRRVTFKEPMTSVLQKSISLESVRERPKRSVGKIDYKAFARKGKTFQANEAVEKREEKLPTTYWEALEREDSNAWREAFDNEIKSLIANNVFEICERPQGNVVGCRWVLTYKQMPDGGIKPKARLVAKGYSQQYGVDYCSVFAPVVEMNSVRLLFALVAIKKLKLVQFDIKTAFLNGDLKETIFMEMPDGYCETGDKVWRLKRSLYGLKQSPRNWNEKFTAALTKLKFITCVDNCIFCRRDPLVILAVYVDDAIICAEDVESCNEVIRELEQDFEINIIRTNRFLGFQYRICPDNSVFIHQTDYIKNLLEREGFSEARSVPTPFENGQMDQADMEMSDQAGYREILGALQFAASQTRIDIAFTVNYLSRYVLGPTNMHWKILKRTLRYLSGTIELGIRYTGQGNLMVYSDADYAGDSSTYKSTSGQVIMCGGGPIGWKSKLQRMNVTSTTEAEYLSMASAIKSILPLRELSKQISFEQLSPTPVLCDNRGTVAIATNEASAQRTRHLGAQLFFTRDQQQRKNIDIKWIANDEQLADILTKPLPKVKFWTNVGKLMVLLSLIMSCVAQENEEQGKVFQASDPIRFHQVNPVIWVTTNKLINVGFERHFVRVGIPNYCREISDKVSKLNNGTLRIMYEKVNSTCNMLRRDVYLPAVKRLDKYNFEKQADLVDETRSKRDVSDMITNQIVQSLKDSANTPLFSPSDIKTLEEVDKLSKEPKRVAAGGWDAAGAAFPLIGPMVDTIIQYNKEDSAYNTVWKHDEDLKKLAQGLIGLNRQIKLQTDINAKSGETIARLNNATNTLMTEMNTISRASPEVSEIVSKLMVIIYRDVESLEQIRAGFEHGYLDSKALVRLGYAYMEPEKPKGYRANGVHVFPRMTHFKLNLHRNIMRFTYVNPIFDVNCTVFESIRLNEWHSDRTLTVYNNKQYAIHNRTNNCSKIISIEDTSAIELYHVSCKQRNRTIRSAWGILESKTLTAMNYRELTTPTIFKHDSKIFIQCYRHNITTELWGTQECPRYPFVVPGWHSYYIDDDTFQWSHRYNEEDREVLSPNLTQEELTEFETINPWKTEFEKNLNNIQSIQSLNREIQAISNGTINVIMDFLEKQPILSTGIIYGIVTISVSIIVIGCIYFKKDRLLELAQTSLVASIVGDRSPSAGLECGGTPQINISVNNPVTFSNVKGEVYPNLFENLSNYTIPSAPSVKTLYNKGNTKEFDSISYHSLPAKIEEESDEETL